MLTTNQLKKTGIALAVSALLGGCASTGKVAQVPQLPLEKITNTATETGSRIWAGTKHLFKLRDRSKDNQVADAYFDEVDIATKDIENYEQQLAEVDTQGVEPLPELQVIDRNDGDASNDLLTVAEAAEGDLQQSTVVTLNEIDVEEVTDATEITAAQSNEDLFHTVGENESLWDLAKMLTGNANNWRILAEVNDLGEAGAIFAGQTIRVPADLKRVPKDGDESVTLAAASVDTTTRSTPEQTSETVAAVDVGPTRSYKVQAGENLWFLAKRTTGNAANWLKIAQANGWDEVQANSIRYGQEIMIPEALLTDESIAALDAPATDGSEDAAKVAAAAAVADAIEPDTEQATDAINNDDVDLNRATDVPADAEISIVEAGFKGEPAKKLELAESNTGEAEVTTTAAAATEAPAEQNGDEVMVSGTYYPKAVYNDANFSSSLLMRVSPGTRLKVSKAMGPWYEVVTEKGVGYVHSRDTK